MLSILETTVLYEIARRHNFAAACPQAVELVACGGIALRAYAPQASLIAQIVSPAVRRKCSYLCVLYHKKHCDGLHVGPCGVRNISSFPGIG